MDTLLGALIGAPALPGARCRGRSHLFDPPDPHEDASQRHLQALGLCEHCPALTACEEWFATLKPSKRPPGVVAGRIVKDRTA